MARILFIWELGEGLGHVSRMEVLAARLKDEGHDVRFAIRDLELAGRFLAERGYEPMAAPTSVVMPIRGPDSNQPTSVADILGAIGFADSDRLTPYIYAWDNLIADYAPDLVILDYAPTAGLALYGSKIPVCVIGDGFSTPPGHLEAFRPYRQARPAFDPKHLLAEANKVQRVRGRPELSRLPEVFAGSRQLVVTYPELDCWAGDRLEPAIGPLQSPKPMTLREPVRDYFAYLSAHHRQIDVLVKGLAESRREGLIFIRDAAPEFKDHMRRLNLNVVDQPQNMSEMIETSSVIIHHGGIGTSEAVLVGGRPQMIAPRHVEQSMNMSSLGKSGVITGLALSAKIEPGHVQQALDRIIQHSDVRSNALNVAKTLTSRGDGPIQIALSTCQELLKQGGA